MAATGDTDESIPLSWILLFVVLVLVVGAAAILAVGGDLIAAGG